MSKTLGYYFYDGSYISLDNYIIDTNGVISNISGKVSRGEIGRALESYRRGKISTRYERTWKVCSA